MHRRNIPTTYEEAREMLKGRGSRTIANNTTLVDLGRAFGPGVREIGLRLHSTYVVRFLGDGAISLHTDGWRTVTTKDRLNRVLRARGWHVYAKAREWFVATTAGSAFKFSEGFTVPARPGAGVRRNAA